MIIYSCNVCAKPIYTKKGFYQYEQNGVMVGAHKKCFKDEATK